MQSPEARRLLAAFVDYLLDHGFAETSLRPAAAAIGTSARMLIHYFGTKDELLIAAMNEFQARQQVLIATELARHPIRDANYHVLAFWRTFASPRRQKFILLLLEMWVAALRNPRRGRTFLDAVDVNMRTTVEMLIGSGLTREQAEVSGTLYLATMRGLMLDLLATGETSRIDAAVALLARLIQEETTAKQTAMNAR
jgi:AcrR family transcriptional regulator